MKPGPGRHFPGGPGPTWHLLQAHDERRTMTDLVLDLYAGAGGWDEGARILGMPTVGLEIWHDACVTAKRAGHPRVQCDIATYPTAPFVGRAAGLIASPPCQAWSMAGNRLGEQDKTRVHELVDQYAAGANTPGGGWADPRSHHAAQPVRWIRDLRPEWVALEQVPPVIDLWRHISDVLRLWGYSVAVGILNAADYGVPQTRKRAILIASRVRAVTMPETTHEHDPQPSLFGERLPWVSMADALGWSSAAGLVNGAQVNATTRPMNEPAGTIYCSRPGNLRWALHANRDQREDGTRQIVATDRPALSPTGKSGGQWVFRSGQSVAGEGRAERQLDEPSVTITSRADLCSWVTERPATTVQGDPRIERPGHKDRAGGESQFEQDSLRVTVAEAAILQSFPADYPWHGNKTSQFLQVGNAVPPRLAAAVIGAATGTDWQTAVTEHYGVTPDVSGLAA